MVKNDFVIDLKAIMRREGKTMESIGEELGLNKATISKRARGKVINKGYVELMETLGYDIEVKYIKRSEE